MPYYAILFHTKPYYSINRDTPIKHLALTSLAVPFSRTILKYGNRKRRKYGNLAKIREVDYEKSAELKGGNVGKDGKAEMAETLIQYGNREKRK